MLCYLYISIIEGPDQCLCMSAVCVPSLDSGGGGGWQHAYTRMSLFLGRVALSAAESLRLCSVGVAVSVWVWACGCRGVGVLVSVFSLLGGRQTSHRTMVRPEAALWSDSRAGLSRAEKGFLLL